MKGRPDTLFFYHHGRMTKKCYPQKNKGKTCHILMTDRIKNAKERGIAMENQYELLQQTLSDYRKLMKETENKIQGVMEDLAKDLGRLTVEMKFGIL